MKPYIEFKGEKLEFEANFKLQKEFRKEYQIIARSNQNILEIIDPNELNSLNKDIQKLKKGAKDKELTQEEIESATLEYLAKYPSLRQFNNFASQDVMDDLYDKYCELMIENKYSHISWEEVRETIVQEDGIGYYYQLCESIIKTVFSSVVEVAPQQKPSFAWEKTSKSN